MAGTTRRISGSRAEGYRASPCHAWATDDGEPVAAPGSGELPAGPSSPVQPSPGQADTLASLVIADDLPDGLVIADQAGRVEVFNAAAVRLTGRSAAEALGQDVRDVLPLRDNDGRSWWACTDPYNGLCTRTRHPEASLYFPDGTEVLATMGYVRERQQEPNAPRRVRRIVISLRGAQPRARLERSRADLVSTVAHELRSPLTSVKGFTATLLAKWHRFTDDQKLVMLETVNADADRVTRLITELLDVSRIEAGRLEMHRQVVDMPTRVHRIIAGRVAVGEPPERFRVEVNGTLPELWLDQDKVDQIIGNLVENALRHGAGTVTVVVEPADPGESGQAVAVSVRDQGEGVADEVASRVFRPFWRATKRGGTGLGLFIVKGLIEAHEGTITVLRAPGGGAEFRFTMPAGTPDFV
jgi:signal transduction histidine kinase